MFTIYPNAYYCFNVTGQLIQSYPRTLSWNKNTDCCSWDGVHCDEMTGQVIELDLSDPYGFSLGPHNFELLLKNLTQLRELHLYGVNISSSIPLNFSSYLTTLRLPFTQLRGVLTKRVFHLSDLEFLDLSSNSQLTVRFPTTKWNSSASLMKLYLYRVNITGRIPESFSHLTSLHELSMGYCNLSGPIPKPLWNLTHIESLFLDDNHLDGPISQFSIFENIKELSLLNNNFEGPLEFLSFNRSWTQLEWLDFSSNSLTGPIPTNVSGLQNLQRLDLSSNRLNGTIPSWIFSLPSLYLLHLSNNTFGGKIQEFKSNTLSQVDLNQNQLEDLLSNGFSGDLPVSLFQNFKAMKTIGENSGTRGYVVDSFSSVYTNSLIVTTKGLDHELPRVLTTEKIIDLSRNRFEASFQNLSLLESLDLSSNKISGAIPPQLASLTFLAVLNLSHNHLIGCIPKGKQFDTFENSSYQGNDGLRGLPPSRDCGRDDRVPQETIPVELDQEEEEEDSPLISWQAVLIGYGCGLVIGLSNYYENEKAQEKIMSDATSRIQVY
ncbi:hypothetical protein KY289_000274 [Solanum tuberosum]|nr:hypothetical protein KY289_000274 [Solanum tuberosum]